MIKLGYDGIIIPRTNGVIHYIVFNPSVINTVSKQIVGEDTNSTNEKKENKDELV
jgi:hypothetical protein